MNAKEMMSVVAGIIIVLSVTIPIISDLSENVNTVQYNESPRFFADDLVSENITYTVEDGQVMYNGAPISGLSDTLAPVVIADTFILVYHMSVSPFLEVRANSTTVSQITDFTVQTDGTYNYTKNGEKTSGSYSKIVYADPNGDYAAIETTSSSTTINMDHGKTGYIFNRAYMPEVNNVLYTGTFNENGLTDLYIEDGEATDVSHNEPIVESNRLYDSFTIANSINADDETLSGILTVIVPYEYHAVTEMDGVILMLLNIIPILLIVGIILGVVYMAVVRRSEY